METETEVETLETDTRASYGIWRIKLKWYLEICIRYQQIKILHWFWWWLVLLVLLPDYKFPDSVEEVKVLDSQHHHGHGRWMKSTMMKRIGEHVYHQLKTGLGRLFMKRHFFFLCYRLVPWHFMRFSTLPKRMVSRFIQKYGRITGYLLPGLLLCWYIILSTAGVNYIFHWMEPTLFNPDHENYDPIIANKSGWLNTTGFLSVP